MNTSDVQGTDVTGVSITSFMCSFCLKSYHMQHMVSCIKCRGLACINCVVDNVCCTTLIDMRAALDDQRMLNDFTKMLSSGVSISVRFTSYTDVRMTMRSVLKEYKKAKRLLIDN